VVVDTVSAFDSFSIYVTIDIVDSFTDVGNSTPLIHSPTLVLFSLLIHLIDTLLSSPVIHSGEMVLFPFLIHSSL
jgi:hypothetical protein